MRLQHVREVMKIVARPGGCEVRPTLIGQGGVRGLDDLVNDVGVRHGKAPQGSPVHEFIGKYSSPPSKWRVVPPKCMPDRCR